MRTLAVLCVSICLAQAGTPFSFTGNGEYRDGVVILEPTPATPAQAIFNEPLPKSFVVKFDIECPKGDLLLYLDDNGHTDTWRLRGEGMKNFVFECKVRNDGMAYTMTSDGARVRSGSRSGVGKNSEPPRLTIEAFHTWKLKIRNFTVSEKR
jgi:hypothetical protein